MRIAVFGLGYVGSVTAVCLAENGHDVWGVDEQPIKVDWMSRGIPPLNEPGFTERLRAALAADSFHATIDAAHAITSTDLALICVGTPTSANNGTNLAALESVIRTINDVLISRPRPYTVAVRSTIPPGTMEGLVMPIFRDGVAQVLGAELKVCFNPEFLREGTAIDDFFNPPYTVVGVANAGPEADALLKAIEASYGVTSAPTICLGFREAELLKVICNTFHALKISFANEVGSLAARVGADPARLMDAFALDRKLNISAVYLRPGFAFGGSCLPKDIRGLLHTGRSVGLDLPLCESILPSNECHLERALAAVLSHPGQVVGLAGLVFKAHTDDVRESGAMWLARRILDRGRKLLIYEPEINIDRLVGANQSFMREHLPEYPRCLVNWDTVADRADVIGVVRPGVISASARQNLTQPVIDLFRLESL